MTHEHTYPYFLLSAINRKEKALSRACHFFRSGAYTLDRAFCLLYLFRERKKVMRPHYQSGCSLILPVTVPYPLLSWDLSSLQLYKAYRTCVRLCFPIIKNDLLQLI